MSNCCYEKLSKAIDERAKKELTAIDPNDPYKPFHSGFYELQIDVNAKTRRMIMYIPEGTQASSAGIFLIPPSGVSIEDFLKNSNWVELADSEETKEKFVLFALEASEGGWNVHEEYGVLDGDVAYINAAYQRGCQRDLICVHEAKYYVCGYGDGGTLAQMAVMWDPAAYAGVVSVDALPVPDAYMEKAGSDFCLNLDGYQDPDHIKGILKSDVPVPTWLIGDKWLDFTSEAKYWQKTCGCDTYYTQIDRDVHAFVRSKETPYPVNQDKEAYRVWTGRIANASADYGRNVNRRIWKDFLYRVRRWMSEPGGSLRLTKDPIRDLGMIYRYEMVDGFMREWYIHVPESVKANPDVKVPLVFAMHGYSCSGEIYMGNSEWYKAADKYGFIVIFPSAIYGVVQTKNSVKGGGVSSSNTPLPMWNTAGYTEGRPYELNYFEHMIKDACEKYPVDKSRIFATGHSNGSHMTLFLGLAKPEWFAAIAPCSGIIFMGANGEKLVTAEEVVSRKKVDMPVWMFGGCKEEWLLKGIPESGNGTDATIKAWWDFNDMPGEAPDKYDDYSVVRDRWLDWKYEKNGVPMIRYTAVDYFPHATMPEMSFRIWEEFFSKFSRDENNEIHYDNK